MMCKRCDEREAVARVESREGDETLIDMPVCAQCARQAQELHLDVKPLQEVAMLVTH